MGTIRVHEFMSLDGVIDAPTWTFDFGFDQALGQDIGNLMSSCDAICWAAIPTRCSNRLGRPAPPRKTPVHR